MEYSVSEIAAICQGTFCGEDVTVRSVVADSRRSVATDGATLFVAIRGRNHDGHDYIADLYRRGVRGFMVEREVDARDYPGAGFVRVDKSLAGLQALAAHYRLSFSGTVVGIDRVERQDYGEGVDRPDGSERDVALPQSPQL